MVDSCWEGDFQRSVDLLEVDPTKKARRKSVSRLDLHLLKIRFARAVFAVSDMDTIFVTGAETRRWKVPPSRKRVY